MEPRTQRAVSFGTRVGIIMGAIGFMRAAVGAFDPRLRWLERVALVFLVPLGSFALFFGLVFAFAYAFPPRTDELSMALSFPGARWVVWPLVAIGAAAVLYLAFRRR